MADEKLIKDLELSDKTFNEFRDFIYELTGLYFSVEKRIILTRKLKNRIVKLGLNSFEQYLHILRTQNIKQEINFLFEAITINESYFFRNELQFHSFYKFIIPDILGSKANDNIIRVWSSACSTGEEAYTIAMIFQEKIKPLFPELQLQVIGSDINNSSLEFARKGTYQHYSIQNVPELYLKKYFLQQGNNYIVSDEIKKLVRFININIYNDKQINNVRNCDVIFSCNVMIYYDLSSRKIIVNNLYNSLNKNGYLFIGYTESLHGISKSFKLVHLPQALAYKKEY